MSAPPAPAVAVRRVRTIKSRERLVADPVHGVGVTTDGRATRWDPAGGAAAMLAAVPNGIGTVELLGASVPGQTAEGFARWRRTDPDVWHASHHLVDPSNPTLRWRHRERGFVITAHLSSVWLAQSAAEMTPADGAAAFVLAHRVLQSFATDGASAPLLATPAMTGRELWRRSIPEGMEIPALPVELADLVRSTSGQGRIQLMPEPWEGATLPEGLIEYDGRRMYTALLDRLPVATAPRLRKGDWFVRFQPGRFRCRWTVPDGWAHVGILPDHRKRGGWRYLRKPGSTGTGWLDAWELQLALDHRWQVEVLESLTYGPQPATGPADAWGKKLRSALDDLDRIGRAARAPEPAVDAARRIVRAIMLHTIGSWHGRSLWTSRTVTEQELTEMDPETYRAPRIEDGAMLVDVRNAPPNAADVHPEWSTAVWARARVRLLDSPSGRPGVRVGALHLPRETIVAMRTDAIYLSVRPAWSDDGKAGRLRYVATHGAGGEAWPATWTELDSIKRGPELTPAEALAAARASLGRP